LIDDRVTDQHPKLYCNVCVCVCVYVYYAEQHFKIAKPSVRGRLLVSMDPKRKEEFLGLYGEMQIAGRSIAMTLIHYQKKLKHPLQLVVVEGPVAEDGLCILSQESC